MKMPNQPIVLCHINSLFNAVDIHWLTRNSLCELRMKDGTREVFAIGLRIR